MVIILCLYLVALRAVFSKFKLVRWGWLSGIDRGRSNYSRNIFSRF